jgi:integrase/recombinase XerC
VRHFKPEQLSKLIDAVPEHYQMIMLIGFWHGLRVSEILGLRSRDIQHGYIKVQRKKGSLPTLQPYVMHKADGVESKLSEFSRLKELAKLPPDTLLFPLTRDAVNKMMTRLNKRLLGLPKCSPHMLKHTIAHVMLDGGKSINEVQAYLGHKSGNSTLQYLKVDEEQAAEGIGNLL